MIHRFGLWAFWGALVLALVGCGGAGDLSVQWKLEGGGAISNHVSPENIYVWRSNGTLNALDRGTGETKWSFQAPGIDGDRPVAVTVGFRIPKRSSSGMELGSAILFEGADSFVVAAKEENGEFLWKYQVKGQVFFSQSLHDSVFFGDGESLHAVNKSTGQRQWRFETNGAVSTVPRVENGLIFFGNDAGVIYAVDASTGEEQWTFEAQATTQARVARVGDQGLVFFGSDDGHVYALTAAKGEPVWKFKTGGVVTTGFMVDGNDWVHFGSSDQHLYVVDGKTGKEHWRFKTECAVSDLSWSSEGVYVGASGDHLYLLNKNTGEQLQKWRMGQSDCPDPFLSRERSLVAFDRLSGKEIVLGNLNTEIEEFQVIQTGSCYHDLLGRHEWGVSMMRVAGSQWRCKFYDDDSCCG